MVFTNEKVSGRVEFLGSRKFLAIPHTFTQNTVSGKAVEFTDGLGRTVTGINLYDVKVDENPNGAVVVQGIILANKLPEKPSTTNLAEGLVFIND